MWITISRCEYLLDGPVNQIIPLNDTWIDYLWDDLIATVFHDGWYL